VPGSFLKRILKKRPPEPQTGDLYAASDYIGKGYYAVSGTDSSDRISGLGIQDDEMYYTAIPESELQGLKNAEEMPSGGETVHSVVTEELTKLRDANPSRGQWENAVKNEAENIPEQRDLWRLNINGLSLYVSKYGVTGRNSGYASVGESRLSSVNQTTIRGSGNLISEYYSGKFRFDFGITADYGKVVLSSYTVESVDNLVFEGELRYKWRSYNGSLGPLTIGPFAAAGWETEFTKDDGVPLKRVLRGKTGLKMFEGTYLRELYFGITTEQDYAETPHYTQYAAETGYKLEYPIPGTTFTLQSNGSYRRFAKSANDTSSDLLDRLEINSKLSTRLYKDLTLDVFANYLYATGKKLSGSGDSTETGFALTYKKLFKLKR